MQKGAACLAALVLMSCSSSTAASVATPTTSVWATTDALGGQLGMDALVAAAKAEGQLNVIGLPGDWANYGDIISAFKAKYGIKVNSLNPNAISQDEIDTVNQSGKSKNAPDVLDLNMTSATANAQLFAPYKVLAWGSIPDTQKSGDGAWYQDYGGFMSIGYDSTKLPAITKFDDLLQAKLKGKVTLVGDPRIDDAALGAIVMVAINEGGGIENVGPGVDFFHRLRKAGNFLATVATQATIAAGQTPLVLDWEFLSRAHVTDVPGWTVVVPGDNVLATYYAQAINKNAPHPAAARLWEEYLYSVDGQNQWLRAGMRPVEMQTLQQAGTLDATAAANLPVVTGTTLLLTPAHVASARTYLSANWAKAIA